MLLFLCSLERK